MKRKVFYIVLIGLALFFPVIVPLVIYPWYVEWKTNELIKNAKGVFKLRGIYIYPYGWRDHGKPLNYSVVMKELADHGFNLILMYVISSSGKALYRSRVVPLDETFLSYFGDKDPLEIIIKEAHRNGLKVWVWVRVGIVAKEVLEKNSHWSMVYANGTLAYLKGVYRLNPACPEARKYVLSYIRELVERYDIDGVSLEDDLGFYRELSFDNYSKAFFIKYLEEKYNISEVKWPDDVFKKYWKEWHKWRCLIVTEFVEEIHRTVKSIKPNVVVSAAVNVPYARRWEIGIYGRNWTQWAELKIIDALCFMIYHRDSGFTVDWVKSEAAEIMKLVGEKVEVLPIVGGAYIYTKDMKPLEWIQAILYAKDAGVKNIAIFHYVCIEGTKSMEKIGKLLNKMKG